MHILLRVERAELGYAHLCSAAGREPNKSEQEGNALAAFTARCCEILEADGKQWGKHVKHLCAQPPRQTHKGAGWQLYARQSKPGEFAHTEQNRKC